MPEKMALDVWSDIATAAELAIVSEGSSRLVALAITLLFSTKEAVFKCLYPIIRAYFDFNDVAVEFIDFGSRTIAIRLTSRYLIDCLGDISLDCRFAVVGETVFTGVLLGNEHADPKVSRTRPVGANDPISRTASSPSATMGA